MLNRYILLSLAIVHFLFSVLSFFLFMRYEFMEPMRSLLIQNFFWSVILFFYFYLSGEDDFVKKFKIAITSYLAIMMVIVTYTFMILPQFTYEEATKLVGIETGKQVVEPEEGEVKAQLGQYYIYTTEEVYIFNAETGSYGAREQVGN